MLLMLSAATPTVWAETTQDSKPPCPHEIWWLPCQVNTEKSDEIKRLIAEELYVGASSEAIEAFFERHGILYSYDEFADRYQAIIRDVSGDAPLDQAVSIYVYIDENGDFEGSEVVDVFTAP